MVYENYENAKPDWELNPEFHDSLKYIYTFKHFSFANPNILLS